MEKPLVMNVSGMEPNLMGVQKGFRFPLTRNCRHLLQMPRIHKRPEHIVWKKVI